MKSYDRNFYELRHSRTLYSARTILSLLLPRLRSVESAVDVGCGVGTWLSVLLERGIKTVRGLDGVWVERDLLEIPEDCFQSVQLADCSRLDRKYDLAISLEVAEHLPEDSAEDFVSMLTDLSDCVLFSAAIPGQGGTNHVNEQWQNYWVELFTERGYSAHDLIRPQIWNDERIPVWYRQNVLVFTRKQAAQSVLVDSSRSTTAALPLDVVHPSVYLNKTDRMQTVLELGKFQSIRTIRRKYKRLIRRLAERPDPPDLRAARQIKP